MAKKAPTQLVCIARFTVKRGKHRQLIAALRKLIRPTRQEKGCIRYEVNQQIDNERVITLVEKWSSKQTFDQHCAMPYTQDYLRNTVPKLVASKSVTLHTEVSS